jgi:oxaloacetate decarboxylase alpha subunit
MIRARHSRGTVLVAEDAEAERGERIRELVKIVQESGVGEIEIEDEGMRVSVRRADEPAAFPFSSVIETDAAAMLTPERRDTDGVVRVESPMVGVFYRAPQPGFVDVGDTVVPGQSFAF